MLINKQEEKIIEDYLQENHQLKQYFVEGSEQIKKEISKKIAYKICDKVDDVRGCFTPNERDVQEKITDSMEEVIDEYYKEIDGYVRLQYNTISDLTDNIGDDQLKIDQPLMIDCLSKPVNYTEIEQDRQIISRIIERVISHIAFRNQNNPDYYKLKAEIEEYVRQEVPSKMDLFKEEMDNLYENILSQLNNKRMDMLNSVESFGIVEEQTISPNAAAFIDNPSPALDSTGIFEDTPKKR